MVDERYRNVFFIQIDALNFAEFEISEFEISSFDCTALILIKLNATMVVQLGSRSDAK